MCQTGLRVTTGADVYAIGDVLEELTAGVEDGQLAVCVIELASLLAGRQLEDPATETPVHQREVTNGIDDGRDGVRRDVYQHALCPEIVVAERRGMGFGHRSRSVPLLVRLLGASYLLLTNVQVLAVLCNDVGLGGEGDGKQHGRLQCDPSIAALPSPTCRAWWPARRRGSSNTNFAFILTITSPSRGHGCIAHTYRALRSGETAAGRVDHQKYW